MLLGSFQLCVDAAFMVLPRDSETIQRLDPPLPLAPWATVKQVQGGDGTVLIYAC